MYWGSLFLAIALTAGAVGTASASDIQRGAYLCTVVQKAGIGATHLEDAPPPSAFIDKRITRFRILVSPTRGLGPSPSFSIEEQPYSGPGRDTTEWHTKNAVLHSVYLGDGRTFTAVEDQAFIRLQIDRTGGLRFYHAGFEYPGGEDVKLSVRSGTCARVR